MNCDHCGKTGIKLGHLGQCRKYKEYLDSIFTAEWINENYIEKQRSAKEIADELGLRATTVIRRIRAMGFETRTVKESAPNSRAKSRVTNLEKYGVEHNFSRDSPSRKAWQNRILREEGITNVFQREDVKQRSLNTLLSRYGVESPGQILTSRGKNVYSSVHKIVVGILNSMEIDFGIEYKIKNSATNRYFAYDIIVSGTRNLIEVNGDYWHGNPEIYKPTDIILKGSSKEMSVSEKWALDAKKIEFAENAGYRVLVLWESKVKSDPDLVASEIRNFVNGSS